MADTVFMGLSSELPMEVMRLQEGDTVTSGGWTWERTDRETLEFYPQGEPDSPRKISVERKRKHIIAAIQAQDQAEMDAQDDEP